MSYASQINSALDELLSADKDVVVGGQLVRYGVAGLTTGLYERFPNQFITYPVAESLMNSSAMGLALAGKRVVMIHVRIDFLASGMCALVNHIPIWRAKGFRLPITLVCQIGRGMGQGPQHSKDISGWFRRFEGWRVVAPRSPAQARGALLDSVRGDEPVIFAIYRELFDSDNEFSVPETDYVALCGASKRHETDFYERRDRGDFSPAINRTVVG
jgi:pyruvate/2-oxoglutarate/acetoin dehydrogenase E1 component